MVIAVQLACRSIKGHGRQRIADVGDVHAKACKLALIDIDPENLVAIAVDLHIGNAGDRGQHIFDLIFDQHCHILNRHRIGRHGKPHNCIGIRIRLDDLR